MAIKHTILSFWGRTLCVKKKSNLNNNKKSSKIHKNPWVIMMTIHNYIWRKVLFQVETPSIHMNSPFDGLRFIFYCVHTLFGLRFRLNSIKLSLIMDAIRLIINFPDSLIDLRGDFWNLEEISKKIWWSSNSTFRSLHKIQEVFFFHSAVV